MADEFNPQGVDQTPQSSNTNETSQAPAGEQTAPAANEAPAQPQAEQTAVTEPIPDYASAKGESTVVSSAPSTPTTALPNDSASTQASQTASTAPLYRPAPEYGAYGPVPTQNQSTGTSNSANNYPFGAPAAQNQAPQGQAGNRNPYFTNNPQPTGNGNPFAPAGSGNTNGPQNGQTPANNGNPFTNPAQGGMFVGNGAPGAPNGNGPLPGQPGQPGAGKPVSKTFGYVLTAVIAAVVAAALCLGLGFAAITNGWVSVPSTSSLSSITSNKSGSGTATAKSGEAVDWTSVASDVSNSVVSIQTTLSNGTAKGSGAILDTEGHIVTNNHVISGAQQIQVTLANGNIYSATLVGADTTTDLAVIKLDNPPSDLKAVEFADSDKLAVGENVMAIGNPLGYDDTATTGIVSALNRPVTVTDDNNNEIVTNAVQIDAAINPGNSGGPTFNAAGQVIGINSSIASTATSSDSAGSIGIGFAIPSNLVKRVANEIIKDGKVKHVALGVTISSATVEADGVTRGGAKITTPSTGGSAVVSGGPADKAGLKADDTIVAFNGNAVNNNYSLLGYVRAAALGDKVTLTIVRNGKTMDVDVTLDQEESSVNGSSSSNSNGNSNNNNQNNQNNQNGNGNNGYGNGSDGNSDGGTGDGGGFSDPFGLW